MKKHVRKVMTSLMLALCVLISLSAESLKYPSLDVAWTFGAAHETFEAGFSKKRPASELNLGWNDIVSVDSIDMRDFISNSSTFHKAEGNVYAYWNFFSNESFTVNLSSTGPLVNDDSNHTENNRNMINWQASWTPLTVNANGDIIEQVGEVVTLGRADNAFESIEYDYSTPRKIFEQTAGNYPLKSKYGFVRIHMETQDTKAENILADHSKVKGGYSTSLILDVMAR